MKYIKSKQTEELLVEISMQTFVIISDFQSKMQFSVTLCQKIIYYDFALIIL